MTPQDRAGAWVPPAHAPVSPVTGAQPARRTTPPAAGGPQTPVSSEPLAESQDTGQTAGGPVTGEGAGPLALTRRPHPGRVAGAAKSRTLHLARAAGRREDYVWLREEQGLTIGQAAERMRVTYRTAQRWEAWQKASQT